MERSELEDNVGAGNGGRDMRDMAAQRLDDVKEWSNELLGRVEGFVRERPGTALLIAVGAGFLVGRLIRHV